MDFADYFYDKLGPFKLKGNKKDDSDGAELLPKEYANVIFYVSFLIAITAIYALSKKYYDIFVFCVLALLTSLNHWRDARFGFRRNIDMLVVNIGFIYLFIRAIILRVKSRLFWFLYFMVVLCYPVTWYLCYKEHMWMSTFVHCVLHLCGNSSVVIFCSSI
jgi:hypothetical protein